MVPKHRQAAFLGATLVVAPLALAGCVVAPPPGPTLLAMPGSGRSPAQFAADDARCRSSAAAQAGLPANVAATDPTQGAATATQAVQDRYNRSYGSCMVAAGEQVPAAQAGTPGVSSTVNPYAYGGYGNEANVPASTAVATGPVYATYSGWGWGWGWDGWYGGIAPAYGYGYYPWVPFGVGLGWGWGGWGWGRPWGGWGYRGGWSGGWHGGGWHGGGWRGGGGWHGGGGGWRGGGFRGGGWHR